MRELGSTVVLLLFMIGMWNVKGQIKPEMFDQPIPLSVSRTPKPDDPVIIVGGELFVYFLLIIFLLLQADWRDFRRRLKRFALARTSFCWTKSRTWVGIAQRRAAVGELIFRLID